ncbi:acyl-CoA dehydrogenase family protein [Mesobacterium pallidum]|uniref:acyl-CoA dehydrogenase family protein n=1 Tax=Mesobacterium pallidum TaxID=2872037 RepID=UPI001EE33983|nr:acyl-CoA dehydrogenase family protein [Mesobacterium pallidum]
MTLDLTLTEELRQVLDAAQQMLDTHYPVSRLREGAADPMAPLAEFGTFLLGFPEDAGGAGLGRVEEAQLHSLLGRHLVSPSAVAVSIAARIALGAEDVDLALAIAGGEVAVCAGVTTPDGPLLIDAGGAAHAVLRDGATLSLVPLAGLATEDAPMMGHGRALARVTSALPAGPEALPEVALLHDLLVSAQLLGVAEAARDLAVDYARTREQFGRPIGAFQAIKHHGANMALGAEMLSAQLDMAALTLDARAPDAGFQVAALARLAPRIALENARLGIQVHGGIGFSAEADAQLYLKQAHLLRALLGPHDMLSFDAPMAPTGKAPS